MSAGNDADYAARLADAAAERKQGSGRAHLAMICQKHTVKRGDLNHYLRQATILERFAKLGITAVGWEPWVIGRVGSVKSDSACKAVASLLRNHEVPNISAVITEVNAYHPHLDQQMDYLIQVGKSSPLRAQQQPLDFQERVQERAGKRAAENIHAAWTTLSNHRSLDTLGLTQPELADMYRAALKVVNRMGMFFLNIPLDIGQEVNV